jgi:cephalosporin hydroxylase
VDGDGLQRVVWAVPGGPDDEEQQQIVSAYDRWYCRNRRRTYRNTRWLGVSALKCPFDLWIYQELVYRIRPDVIVETGTALGGSAYFLASLCDMLGTGRVVTIDISVPPHKRVPVRPPHPRISYLTGSSTDPQIVAAVRRMIAPGDTVMVLLDSDHAADHVREEMRAYAPLVTEGSYLIVEDTNINDWFEFGPGPLEAVTDFLAEDDRFSVDRSLEKFMMTFNPGGFLLRQKASERSPQPGLSP